MSRHERDRRKSRSLFLDRMDRKAAKLAQSGISFREAISRVFQDGKQFPKPG